MALILMALAQRHLSGVRSPIVINPQLKRSQCLVTVPAWPAYFIENPTTDFIVLDLNFNRLSR